jgi:hypothetical protein
MNVRTRSGLIVCSVLALGASFAHAKSPKDYAVDLKDYVLSPIHWGEEQWRWAGIATLGVASAYALDNQVRDHFAVAGVRTPSEPHGSRDAAPLGVLLLGGFALEKLRSDNTLSHMGMDMGESVVLATVSTQALKLIADRKRPNQSGSRSDFGAGGDSFPSGHTAAAFAAAQVFADRMPREQWGWRVLAYGLAGATAYARLDSNMHWFSDTVAGAALGIATGRFVSGRAEEQRSRVAYWVTPMDRGALVSFSVRMD